MAQICLNFITSKLRNINWIVGCNLISKNNFLLYVLKCIYISVAVGEISLPQLNAYLLHRILLIYIYVFALHQKGYPSWMKQLTIKENVLFSILWYTSLGHKFYVRESISKHVFIGTKFIRRCLDNLCTRLFLERCFIYDAWLWM